MTKLVQHLYNVFRRHPWFERTRYALIARLGDTRTFQSEDANRYCRPHRVPAEFREVVGRLDFPGQNSFQNTLRLAQDLSLGHRRGRGLSTDSRNALQAIYRNIGGTCSDYAQVFTGLCLAAGIRVQEWGVTDDMRVSRIGHAFNEVFAEDHNKWVFLDLYRAVYAVHRTTGELLRVSEMIDLASAGQKEVVEFRYFDEARRGFESRPHPALYLNPEHIFFLLSNYRLFAQDRWLQWSRTVPLAILHLGMMMAGVYQRDEIYTNPHTRCQMEQKLRKLRQQVFLFWR